MGFRLSKIITKTGDQGCTRLGSGESVSKGSAQIMAIGCIDELNTSLGLLRLYINDAAITENIIIIQHHLLLVGAVMAASKRAELQERHIIFIEQWAAALMTQLDPVQDFVLPGGSPAGAHCHVARVICRRAECQLVAAQLDDALTRYAQPYLNRLSDLLFILARVLNKHDGVTEIVFNRQI